MKVLITGGTAMLARAVRTEFEGRGHDVVALDRAALDVTDAGAVEHEIASQRPHAVVHCAAYTRVDDAEREEDLARAVNAEGAGNVARACAMVGARMIYPSTDYVFDGEADAPYAPEATTNPVNAYGRSKLSGEVAVRGAAGGEAFRDVLVVRTSWLYGAGGRNFVAAMLERARAGEPLRVVDDQRGAPTWTRSLAGVFADLLEARAAPGTYHAANRGETTWYGLAREAIRVAGVEASIDPVDRGAFPRPARRPRYSVLDCSGTEAVVGPIAEWRDALAAAVVEGL